MRSWPGVQVRVPSVASVMAKKDFRVSLSRMPLGYSAEWFDIRAGMKVWAALETATPAKGAKKK